jgi:hypothetical protein
MKLQGFVVVPSKEKEPAPGPKIPVFVKSVPFNEMTELSSAT